MKASFTLRVVLLQLVVILSLMGSSAFAAGPQDWIGTWNLFLSKVHPNNLPKTLVISEKGDCAAQERWRCFFVVISRKKENIFRGQIVRMADKDRHAIFQVRSSTGGGRTEFEAHIYVGRRLMSGTFKSIDAKVQVPVGYFTASRKP